MKLKRRKKKNEILADLFICHLICIVGAFSRSVLLLKT